MLHSITSTLLEVVIGIVVTVIGGTATVYVPALFKWTRAHIQNRAVGEAFNLVTARIAVAVQARADAVRRAKDPKDTAAGPWTPDVAKAFLAAAVADVVSELPAQVAIIRKGLADGRTLEDVLRVEAEAAVEKLRRANLTGGLTTVVETLRLDAPAPGQSGPVQATATASATSPGGGQ